MGYVLGIDQGGTHTRAAIMDFSGSISSYCKTGGCYFPRDGIEDAMDAISSVAESALQSADREIDEIDLIVAGITGIDWDGDSTLVSDALKKRFGEKEIIACNDCEIAYYGGSLKPVGAAICLGTGANAVLFAPDSKKFVMSDYLKNSLQGGSALTQRALEAAVESDLGVLPKTELTKIFLDFAHRDSVYEVLKKCAREGDFAGQAISLVPLILEAAARGDCVTRDILATFSNELCACFIAAMQKMDMLEFDCDIVLTGSVLSGSANVLTTMIEGELLQVAKKAHIVNAKFEPVVGACILGVLKKARKFDTNMARNLNASAGSLAR